MIEKKQSFSGRSPKVLDFQLAKMKRLLEKDGFRILDSEGSILEVGDAQKIKRENDSITLP